MPCYSPLKGYKDEETGGLKFRRDDTKETMDVACGQCIGCRADRARMWAVRITHECSLYESQLGNSFITLTYRDPIECTEQQLKRREFIPPDWSLQKSHFQKFMKRLRKEKAKAFRDKGVNESPVTKYYHCGEYGSHCIHGIDLSKVKCPLCNVGRPHYHAILINHSFDDLEPYATQDGVTRYTSPELERLWGYGFVDVGDVTYQSAAYVAGYIMKKINGVNKEEHYERITEHGEILKLQEEYSTMSNGIGKDFYNKYKGDFFPSDETPILGENKVVKKVPRYYEELYKETNPEEYEEIKQKRLDYRLENAEEYTSDRLMSKYKIHKARDGLNPRGTHT